MADTRSAEPIMDVLSGLQRRKGFLGLKMENFSLIVTPRRLVFAAVSSGVMREAVRQARREAKDHGAGFVGQWGAQLAWMGVLERRYREMPVDAMIDQFPGSFYLLNTDIRSISTRTEEDDEGSRDTHELHIETSSAKYRFQLMRGTADEARKILSQHMPNTMT